MQLVIDIDTQDRQLISVTECIRQRVKCTEIKTGLCHLFIQHTSASLLIMENADPDVLVD